MALPQISPGVYWRKTSSVTTTDGARIAYRTLDKDATSPGPAVVLLGGFLCPDTWWHDLTPALIDAGFRVVLLHYRGIATSTRPTDRDAAPMSIEQYAGDAVDVMDDAGIGVAHLIGHSMGGQVMFEVARRIPERTTSMISVTGAYRSPTRDLYGQGWLVSPVISHLIRVLRLIREPIGGVVWRTIWRTFPFLPIGRAATAFSSRTPADIIASYEDHAETLSGQYFVEALRAMHAHEPGELLSTLDIPTLVITGDADPFTPATVARRMVRQLPQAKLMFVPNTSHGAILEEPELVNAAIITFLTAHGPGTVRD